MYTQHEKGSLNQLAWVITCPSVRPRAGHVSAGGGGIIRMYMCGFGNGGQCTPAFQERLPSMAMSYRGAQGRPHSDAELRFRIRNVWGWCLGQASERN